MFLTCSFVLIAKSCIIPTLFYGLEIYANCDVTSQHKLKIAYNSIARFIFNLHRSGHVTQFAYKIFDISLADYIKSRTIIFLHKVIYTREPSYLFKKLQFSTSTRTKNIICLQHRFLLSNRQFFINTIRTWNELPNYIKKLGAQHYLRQNFSHT